MSLPKSVPAFGKSQQKSDRRACLCFKRPACMSVKYPQAQGIPDQVRDDSTTIADKIYPFLFGKDDSSPVMRGLAHFLNQHPQHNQHSQLKIKFSSVHVPSHTEIEHRG